MIDDHPNAESPIGSARKTAPPPGPYGGYGCPYGQKITLPSASTTACRLLRSLPWMRRLPLEAGPCTDCLQSGASCIGTSSCHIRSPSLTCSGLHLEASRSNSHLLAPALSVGCRSWRNSRRPVFRSAHSQEDCRRHRRKLVVIDQVKQRAAEKPLYRRREIPACCNGPGRFLTRSTAPRRSVCALNSRSPTVESLMAVLMSVASGNLTASESRLRAMF